MNKGLFLPAPPKFNRMNLMQIAATPFTMEDLANIRTAPDVWDCFAQLKVYPSLM